MAFKIVSKADPEGVSSNELASKADLTGANFTGQVNVVSATATGSTSTRQITISTSEPTSTNGSNGDVWFKYQA